MRRYISEFMRRGLAACGLGPIILAVLYLILQRCGALDVMTVNQVCRGIFSITALAFIAGGMNVVYQLERLPLMVAILIHGAVLYISYLGTYLINDWLEQGLMPILIFTGIFAAGYLLIWVIIYGITRRNTERLNRMLREKQEV